MSIKGLYFCCVPHRKIGYLHWNNLVVGISYQEDSFKFWIFLFGVFAFFNDHQWSQNYFSSNHICLPREVLMRIGRSMQGSLGIKTMQLREWEHRRGETSLKNIYFLTCKNWVQVLSFYILLSILMK